MISCAKQLPFAVKRDIIPIINKQNKSKNDKL